MQSASYIRQPMLAEPVGVIAGPLFPNVLEDGFTASSCVHFWVIDSPNGPTSHGKCKMCSEVREFRNSMYSSTWTKATGS